MQSAETQPENEDDGGVEDAPGEDVDDEIKGEVVVPRFHFELVLMLCLGVRRFFIEFGHVDCVDCLSGSLVLGGPIGLLLGWWTD